MNSRKFNSFLQEFIEQSGFPPYVTFLSYFDQKVFVVFNVNNVNIAAVFDTCAY